MVLIKANGEIIVVHLFAEDKASKEDVRKKLRSSHLDDSEIVVLKHDI